MRDEKKKVDRDSKMIWVEMLQQRYGKNGEEPIKMYALNPNWIGRRKRRGDA